MAAETTAGGRSVNSAKAADWRGMTTEAATARSVARKLDIPIRPPGCSYRSAGSCPAGTRDGTDPCECGDPLGAGPAGKRDVPVWIPSRAEYITSTRAGKRSARPGRKWSSTGASARAVGDG